MKKNWWKNTFITFCILHVSSFSFMGIGSAQSPAVYKQADLTGHWAEKLITDFVYAGNVTGYNVNGTYYVRPDRLITRAEFAAILVRSLGLTSSNPGTQFTDVKSGDWFADTVRIASSLGIINGYPNGEFRPNRNIQRDEMTAMAFRVFHDTVDPRDEYNTYSDVPLYYDPKTGKYNKTYWAAEAIQKVSAREIINGYPNRTFRPYNNATRAEATKILSAGVHKEDGALFDLIPVTDWVHDYQWNFFNYMNDKRYNDGATVNNQYAIGYLKVLYDEALNQIKSKVADGWTVDIRMVRAPVTSIYNPQHLLNGELFLRYAAVSLTGEYELTYTKGSEVQKVIMNVDSIVYLKKLNNKDWKMYASVKI